jgi:hypothetical protein
MKPDSHVIHILPCDNPGSFEHRIASSRKGGIDSEMENRFFYEDSGHVRRLNTFQLNELMGDYGYVLTHSYYANQYHGAVRWMSRTSIPMILKLTDARFAIDGETKAWFRKLRLRLLFLYVIQLPSSLMGRLSLIYNKSLLYRLMQLFLFLPSLVSRPFHAWVDGKASSEWDRQKQSENGSEMYMHYARIDR